MCSYMVHGLCVRGACISVYRVHGEAGQRPHMSSSIALYLTLSYRVSLNQTVSIPLDWLAIKLHDLPLSTPTTKLQLHTGTFNHIQLFLWVPQVPSQIHLLLQQVLLATKPVS